MKNFILFALFAILVSCQKEDDKVVFDLIGENSVNIAEVAYSAYVPMNTTLAYKAKPSEEWVKILDKKTLGFVVEAERNFSSIERKAEVELSAEGAEPIIYTINQKGSPAFFDIKYDLTEMKVGAEAGTAKILIETNVAVVVESDQEWCFVGEVDYEAINLQLEENKGLRRISNLTIKPEGFEVQEFSVIQAGGALIIKNGNFVNDFEHWTKSGDDLFTLSSWLPEGFSEGQNLTNPGEWWAYPNPLEARLSQQLSGMPAGEYEFSVYRAGGSGKPGELYFFVLEEDGTEKLYRIDDWDDKYHKITRKVEITGPNVTVGLLDKRPAGAEVWYALYNLKLE